MKKRFKISQGLAVLILVVTLAAMGLSYGIVSNRTKERRDAAIREDDEYRRRAEKDRANYFQQRAEIEEAKKTGTPKRPLTRGQAGKDAGAAAGILQGMLGKSYPSDAEILQSAKTLAVDTGTTPDDSEFVRAFLRSFPDGYTEGRRNRQK